MMVHGFLFSNNLQSLHKPYFVDNENAMRRHRYSNNEINNKHAFNNKCPISKRLLGKVAISKSSRKHVRNEYVTSQDR